MRDLLSQRGSQHKRIVAESEVPSWSMFAEEYGSKVGYSVRQLRNLINEYHRSSGEASTVSPRKVTCRALPMLKSLLFLQERLAHHVPPLIMTAHRYIKQAMDGKITHSQWQEKEKEVLAQLERAFPETAIEDQHRALSSVASCSCPTTQSDSSPYSASLNSDAADGIPSNPAKEPHSKKRKSSLQRPESYTGSRAREGILMEPLQFTVQ